MSTRIKTLEEALGILLFERRHRGVRLTEAGRRFVTEISIAIDHLDSAIRSAAAVSSGASGRVSIGVISSIAGDVLADLRARFREAYPDVEQAVVEGHSAQTIALVRDGKLDVALVLNPIDAPDCHSRLLWTEPFLIAVPAKHALAGSSSVSWSDVASETFLLRSSGAGPQFYEHVVRRMAERGQSPIVRRCDVSRDMLMHMIAVGDGVTLVSETARHMPWPGVVFREILDETEQARFSAVWSPHNRSTALRNLLDLAAPVGSMRRR